MSNKHPQSKYAWVVLLGIAIGVSFMSQGRGTILNALGASLGQVLAAAFLSCIIVGSLWLISLLVTRSGYRPLLWVNAAAAVTLLLTLLIILFGPSILSRVQPERGNQDETQQLSDEPGPMVEVISVDLGNRVGADNRIANPMTTFDISDAIHASIITAGDGGNVSTRWSYEEGQVFHIEENQVPAGDQITDVMVINANGWPTGHYTMEVLVEGQVVKTREFEVR